MPWAKSMAGVVQAWYGRNETGHAIADLLFGDVNPSGKLPFSIPMRVEDNPAYLKYRSARGRALYGEDVYVGYRYYEAVKRTVLWPFGWGLSYTNPSLSNVNLKVKRRGEDVVLEVSVSVAKTGALDGSEVVQLYVSQRSPSMRRPPKELNNFVKTSVSCGELAEFWRII